MAVFVKIMFAGCDFVPEYINASCRCSVSRVVSPVHGKEEGCEKPVVYCGANTKAKKGPNEDAFQIMDLNATTSMQRLRVVVRWCR